MTDIDPMALRGLRIRRVLLAAATSAVAALAVWFVTRPGPARLVEQGIAAVRRDPAKGEQLFRRAIAAAARQLTRLEPESAGRWALLIGLFKAMYRETDCLAAVREALEHRPPPEFENEFRHRLVQQLIVAGDSAAAWKELARLHET